MGGHSPLADLATSHRGDYSGALGIADGSCNEEAALMAVNDMGPPIPGVGFRIFNSVLALCAFRCQGLRSGPNQQNRPGRQTPRVFNSNSRLLESLAVAPRFPT